MFRCREGTCGARYGQGLSGGGTRGRPQPERPDVRRDSHPEGRAGAARPGRRGRPGCRPEACRGPPAGGARPGQRCARAKSQSVQESAAAQAHRRRYALVGSNLSELRPPARLPADRGQPATVADTKGDRRPTAFAGPATPADSALPTNIIQIGWRLCMCSEFRVGRCVSASYGNLDKNDGF
jgi:hypothetical protein